MALIVRSACLLWIMFDCPMIVTRSTEHGVVLAWRRLRRLEVQRVVCEPSSIMARVETVLLPALTLTGRMRK